MAIVNISGLNKAEVLAGLYNYAKPQGMGFLQYDPKEMTISEAQNLIDQGQLDFDYLKGRVMKVNISGDELETWLYDRDNGPTCARAVISKIKREVIGNEKEF